MPIDAHPARTTGRTPEEIVATQKADAARAKAQAVVSVKPPGTPAILAADARTDVEKYLDEVAPSSITGQLVKFAKGGKFMIVGTEEEIGPDTDFVALCDETLIGWIMFHGEGEPPTRHQGLLYSSFKMLPRASLGDLDESLWPEGLNGGPEDPWKHQMYVVLQNPQSQAFYTFVTSSTTGRNGVGKLLKHYDRMRRNDPDSYPLVRLKPAGYLSKKPGVGWVDTPSFQIVGRVPKSSAAVPDTSVAADLDDRIPF